MINKLLEENFGKHYGSPKRVVVECRVINGMSTFCDPKACETCKNLHDCDSIVLKIDTVDNNVQVIQLEKFIDNYSNLKRIPKGMRCDLLFEGEEKIVFCDMTCCYSKYLNPFKMQDGTLKIGKRETVKAQVENSIKMLTDIPELASTIGKKKEKIALFAYREKDEIVKDDFDGIVSMNMRKLGNIQKKVLSEPMLTDMDNGFMFTEIKYPNVYMWLSSTTAIMLN